MTTLAELENASTVSLAANTSLFRVQRASPRPGSVVIGALHLPPRGLLNNRFDVATDDAAYFAAMDVTAIYETLMRREATAVSLAGELALRELLTLNTTVVMKLHDLRPYAPRWPVLQSLRYGVTQQLATSLRTVGSDGFIYRSAQHHGADCFCIIGAGVLATLHLVAQVPMTNASGNLHRVVADALRGSQVPLVP